MIMSGPFVWEFSLRNHFCIKTQFVRIRRRFGFSVSEESESQKKKKKTFTQSENHIF